jgi:gliding motility-associated-like protein
VVGEIVVYNAVSPNEDHRNPILLLEYIENLADTRENHVTIFNRWGDVVWEGINYNNTSIVFRGNSKNGDALPSGTYFYRIEFTSGRSQQIGYLAVKR